MFVKIVRPTITKVIECHGYNIQRYFHHDNSEVLLEDGGAPPKGVTPYLVLELRPNKEAFSIPEEPPNRIFFMNAQGETVDCLRWD